MIGAQGIDGEQDHVRVAVSARDGGVDRGVGPDREREGSLLGEACGLEAEAERLPGQRSQGNAPIPPCRSGASFGIEDLREEGLAAIAVAREHRELDGVPAPIRLQQADSELQLGCLRDLDRRRPEPRQVVQVDGIGQRRHRHLLALGIGGDGDLEQDRGLPGSAADPMHPGRQLQPVPAHLHPGHHEQGSSLAERLRHRLSPGQDAVARAILEILGPEQRLARRRAQHVARLVAQRRRGMVEGDRPI